MEVIWSSKMLVSNHYTALHYTILHYIAPHYTTLHYTTLHYTTLHCTILHYISLLITDVNGINKNHYSTLDKKFQYLIVFHYIT